MSLQRALATTTFAVLLGIAGCQAAPADAPTAKPAAATKVAAQPATLPIEYERPVSELVEAAVAEFTGDFDEIRKRRQLRVLVVDSKTHYFVVKGRQRGISYDSMAGFEQYLNRKYTTGHLKTNVFFVPVARDKLIPDLLAGKGDIAVAALTITPERDAQIDYTQPVMPNINEILVTGPASDVVSTRDDLSGKNLYVRASSSYYSSLKALNADFVSRGKAPAILHAMPESLEDEDLLEMVNAGLIKQIVVDDYLATFWKQMLPNIVLHPNIQLRSNGNIAWMVRPNSPLLLAELNGFLARYPLGSSTRNAVLQRYLTGTKYVTNALSASERQKYDQTIDLFRTYGKQYNMDYLMMTAQGYQESRLEQKARSPVGAIGVMQIMPATGRELNVGDITQIEPNIHGGVKYIRRMIDEQFAKEPMDAVNKQLFAFAAYNAGPGRVRQLRRRAQRSGLDQNQWFDNVEREAAAAIGAETVTYVSNIHKYYVAYSLVAEEQEKRERAKQAIRGK